MSKCNWCSKKAIRRQMFLPNLQACQEHEGFLFDNQHIIYKPIKEVAQ